ncbi:HEAT repeat domain-containing protein [Streptomyces sp. NPDC101227]|uniref:HEAT repeat domain-containing protein n=1 Tax=Streptomyces sp. NPDC101227 TaxID=3366136 RepID=UPI00381CE967
MSDHTEPPVEALVETLHSSQHDEYRAVVEQLTALGPVAIGPLLASCAGGSKETRSVFRCLARMGEPAVAALQGIRRHGPGRLRRHALQALAELGGADALSGEDRLAVERLIRLKLMDEKPTTRKHVRLPSASWLAIPADQVPGAVRALRLHDLRPATLAMGVSAAYGDHRDSMPYRTTDGKRETAYRIFITPDMNGWRLIYGRMFIYENGGIDLAIQLSSACGQAHFYDIDDGNDSRAWWIAENGKTRRGYSNHWHSGGIGEPLPFEVTAAEFRASEKEMDEEEGIASDDDDFYDDAFDDDDFFNDVLDDDDEEGSHRDTTEERPAEGRPIVPPETDPLDVAYEMSVPPYALSGLTLHDHGWLATTATELPNSRFPGALSL